MYQIKIKRIYASPEPSDGRRYLVDRLWPRGIKKEKAALDGWFKTIAPSAELRKSFAHQQERFAGFREAYQQELDASPEAAEFARLCKKEVLSGNVSLLYAAKDESCNNAAVLREWIERQQQGI